MLAVKFLKSIETHSILSEEPTAREPLNNHGLWPWLYFTPERGEIKISRALSRRRLALPHGQRPWSTPENPEGVFR
jgi:hypothetical protein